MRKVCSTIALLLIGIVAPILACSDNSGKPTMNLLTKPVIAASTTEDSAQNSLAQMPWTENKNLSDKDINKIGR